MRHRPDGTFKWIGHYMDHWAKFHILFALMRKSAAEVALNLQNHVFAILGIPRILHSDAMKSFIALSRSGQAKSQLLMAGHATLNAKALLSRATTWLKSFLELACMNTREMISQPELSGYHSFNVSLEGIPYITYIEGKRRASGQL